LVLERFTKIEQNNLHGASICRLQAAEAFHNPSQGRGRRRRRDGIYAHAPLGEARFVPPIMEPVHMEEHPHEAVLQVLRGTGRLGVIVLVIEGTLL